MSDGKLFNSDICCSEAFLRLPASARVLYMHLLIETNDNGICDHPKAVCRAVRVSFDDLLLLLSSGFLLPRADGVLVVNSLDHNHPYDDGKDSEGGGN